MATAQQIEALDRATNGHSKNDEFVYAMLSLAGYADVQPRVNCLTFNAWKAAGRSVKKGEKGLGVTVWIPCKDKDAKPDPKTGEARKSMRPKTTYIFHIDQTQPIGTKQEAPAEPSAPAETGMIIAPESDIIDVEYTVDVIEPKRLAAPAQKQLSLF
jgi:hypothetical protein